MSANRAAPQGPDLAAYEVWFVAGSQHLYGPKPSNRWRNTRSRSPIPSSVGVVPFR